MTCSDPCADASEYQERNWSQLQILQNTRSTIPSARTAAKVDDLTVEEFRAMLSGSCTELELRLNARLNRLEDILTEFGHVFRDESNHNEQAHFELRCRDESCSTSESKDDLHQQSSIESKQSPPKGKESQRDKRNRLGSTMSRSDAAAAVREPFACLNLDITDTTKAKGEPPLSESFKGSPGFAEPISSGQAKEFTPAVSRSSPGGKTSNSLPKGSPSVKSLGPEVVSPEIPSTPPQNVLNIFDPADAIRNINHLRKGLSKHMLVDGLQRTWWVWKKRLEGQGFDLFVGMLIIVNSLVMAVQLEYEGSNTAERIDLSKDTSKWFSPEFSFKVLEHFFTAVFILELVARVAIWGKPYFRSWGNRMDVAIVCISAVDLYILQSVGISIPNIIFLRLLRIVKLARILRVVAVLRSFRHLRVLVSSIGASFPALLWSISFLGLVNLLASILMAQTLQLYLRDDKNDLATRQFVYAYFGTTFRTIITMFEITLAPGAWSKVGRVIIFDVHRAYAAFFIVYLTVVTFGIMRIVTAMFLKETLAAAQNDQDMIIEEQLRKKERYRCNLWGLFKKMAGDEEEVTMESLTAMINDPRSAAWFQILEVDANDVFTLFELLSEGSGSFTFSDFLSGVTRIKGGAKSIDLITVLVENRKLAENLLDLGQAMQAVITNVELIASKSNIHSKELKGGPFKPYWLL